MPLMFTNYGMIEGETNEVVFRLLNEMTTRPIVRITDQQLDEANAQVEARLSAWSSRIMRCGGRSIRHLRCWCYSLCSLPDAGNVPFPW